LVRENFWKRGEKLRREKIKRELRFSSQPGKGETNNSVVLIDSNSDD